MNALTDRFGRFHNYLRISVTDRCNLRCIYCMPKEGLVWKEREDILTYEEIVRIARVFAGLGVDKIRLTGGEPTIRHDIEFLIEQLAAIAGIQSLLMTTNGTTLGQTAALYRERGLTGLNISLDTLQPDKFSKITRRDNFIDVLNGIDAALEAGYESIKLNVVLMAGINDDEVMDFVHFVQDKPLNVRFIEFMPFKNNGWQGGTLVPFTQIRSVIEASYALTPILTEASAVAKDFAIEGFQGTVSFITSMTESFCGTCNRIRLTADGNLKSCLFHHEEVPVRDHLRQGMDDRTLVNKIREALSLKPEAHAPMEVLANQDNRSMIQIGG